MSLSQPKNLPKTFPWLPLIIGIEIFLVTLYALSVHLNGGYPTHLFDVNGFKTLPSWLQAIQLFCLGALPLWGCITYRHPHVPPSRQFLATIALLFLYASLDEIFKFNIRFHLHRQWQIIYLVLGVTIPVLFHRDLVKLWRSHPKDMRLVALGILLFAAGGVGLELFRVYIQQPYWYPLFGRWDFYQVDSIRTALEELGEMVGETLVLRGMINLAKQRSAL
jgi:hypothetical protein